MNDQVIFNWLSTILFLFLALIWDKTSFGNMILKFILLLLGGAGIFILLVSYGYLVKR